MSIYSASLCSTMQQQPLDKEASLWDSDDGWGGGQLRERTEGLLVGYRGSARRVGKVEGVLRSGASRGRGDEDGGGGGVLLFLQG